MHTNLHACAFILLPLQDLERLHSEDRERWRLELVDAVRAAREEEVAAQAQQRLDATTKQAMRDNEAMAGTAKGARPHGAVDIQQGSEREWSAL